MKNFITRMDPLFLYLTIEVKEKEKLEDYLSFLSKSGVYDLLDFKSEEQLKKGGRPEYKPADLLAVILFGFAFNKSSIRDLQEACKYDLRFIYLIRQETPSYKIFANFINNYIVPNRNEIFALLVKQIANECGFTDQDGYIDGTKFEADANKYKFVYKPTTWHKNLCTKIRNLLTSLGLDRGIPEDEIFSSKIISEKVTELSSIVEKTSDDKSKKINESKLNNLVTYLTKAIEYEEKERICGPDRNSYYKSDHDATAMCLKTDYYSGLGSNMHAAYNCQILVCQGLIYSFYISQSRNDINDFIPILEKFNKYYGHYPKNVCADAGYGSYDNYKYLKANNIISYVKHQSFAGNVSGRNPDQYELLEDDTIRCLNGNIGKETRLINRHPRKEAAVFYKVEGCNECAFSTYCKRYMKDKSEDFKIFEINKEYERLKKESFNNLLSVEGIEKRVNRSIQVEGAFGVIKQDMNYTRSRRTGIEKVETEYMLTYIGYNIRKLFRYFDGKLKKDYWVAPCGTKMEVPKKPSAKRLANKVNKKKSQNSPNSEAKKKYKKKYKHK